MPIILARMSEPAIAVAGPSGAGPKTFDALAAVLQRDFERLTPSQRKLARRVLGDPEGCAFMTITELAQAVEVNESSVVRFATSLGLDGYPALARLCRERLREQAQLLRRFDTLEQLGTGGDDLIERAVSFDQANILRTFARVDAATWDSAVQALSTGRRVYVLGLRKSYASAYLLSYLLQLVRDEVEDLALGHRTLPDRLRGLGPEDVFVGVSIYRYSRDVLRALRFASRRGATTIALTDNPASPLSRHGDLVFHVDTAGVSVLRSVTGFVSLIQALVAGVAARLGATTREALLLQEEVLREFDVYEPETEQDGDNGGIPSHRVPQGDGASATAPNTSAGG
jgi:DNA-binding MurR/RpiR family transcriptional regulator